MLGIYWQGAEMEERKSTKKIHGGETRLFDLPTELLHEIFCRLTSVKNIVQLRSVCKTWYRKVTDPAFISMHAHWCSKNHSGYLISANCGSQLSRVDKALNFSQKLEFPSSISGHSLRIVGCCDGLLCISRDTSHQKHHFPTTYLWNPSIGALKKLPETTHHLYLANTNSCSFVSAFCFDSRRSDYKVFHIVREKLSSRRSVTMSCLYSLKTNSWKEIRGSCSFPCRFSLAHTAFDGAFYWITSYWRFIMRFDFCDETIRKSELPIELESDRGDAKLLFSIGPLKNSLVLYVSDALKRPRGPCTIRTWVMKNEMWERQLSVVISSQLVMPLRPGLNDGEILVSYICFHDKRKRRHLPFGVYDPQNNNIREIDTHLFDLPNFPLLVTALFTYSESLLLLKGRATF